jgi:gliding motility associated protien GldN
MKRLILVISALMASLACLYAQKNIRESDQMYKKTVVRALDLRERQNKPLFSKNREITRHLIEFVKAGKLTPYTSDSLTTKVSMEDFLNKMILPSSEVLTKDTATLMIEFPDTWEEMLRNPPQLAYYFPKDLYQLEIKEEVIFDKQKSRMTYNIIAITIFIPADHPENIKGIQEVVASFDYKELVEKVFKDNPNAKGFNPQNDAEHKNLADMFELRLFSSYLVKVSNPDDLYLTDIYKDQQRGIMASQWASHELLEYEHHLWEF